MIRALAAAGRRAAGLICVLCICTPASAHVTGFADHGHEAGKTFTAIALSRNLVRVLYTVPKADLARTIGDRTPRQPDAYIDRIREGLVLENLESPCTPARITAVDYDAIGAYQYTLDFECSEALDFLTFRYRLFTDDPAHQNLTEIIIGPHTLQLTMGQAIPFIEVPVAHLAWERGTSWMPPRTLPTLAGAKPTLTGYLKLGFEHVVTGYDHVAFVLGLVLLVRRFRDTAIAITAFTVAHSITLGVSAAGLWVVPPAVTEPLIAVSIVVVGAENLLLLALRDHAPDVLVGRAALSRRWVLAFGFGLVHGFGFSYLLRTIGLPERTFLPSLAMFNVGVEIAQLGVVVMPFLVLRHLAARRHFFVFVAATGSVAITSLGIWWLLERVGLV